MNELTPMEHCLASLLHQNVHNLNAFSSHLNILKKSEGVEGGYMMTTMVSIATAANQILEISKAIDISPYFSDHETHVKIIDMCTGIVGKAVEMNLLSEKKGDISNASISAESVEEKQ